jgi:hypothetical protein
MQIEPTFARAVRRAGLPFTGLTNPRRKLGGLRQIQRESGG